MKFTVATCTYNRAHTLPLVYKCLTEQTFRDFEWVIVDDGSTDNTRAIVESWATSAPFPIRYFFQENQHKKVAFNRAVKEAKGELILNWDSDDGAIPQALQTFSNTWDAIPEADRVRFVGVTCLCMRVDGTTVGDAFPFDSFDSDTIESSYVLKIRGEKWGFQRREVLLQFPFPEKVRGLVPEGYVWLQIARKYRTRYINKKLRIYTQSLDSLTGALNQFSQIQILEGRIFYYRFFLDEIAPVLFDRRAPRRVFLSAVQYCRLNLHATIQREDLQIKLKTIPARIIVAFAFPVGLGLFLLDTIRAFTRRL